MSVELGCDGHKMKAVPGCELCYAYLQGTRDAMRDEVKRLYSSQFKGAVDCLKWEADRIPLGDGNQEKGFPSTYNALMFAVETLQKKQAGA